MLDRTDDVSIKAEHWLDEFERAPPAGPDAPVTQTPPAG
jgi:hypothetical protein